MSNMFFVTFLTFTAYGWARGGGGVITPGVEWQILGCMHGYGHFPLSDR